MKPDGKFELVEELQKAGHTILMVGDGLNDSAALTLSDIGVVMNESADISKQMSDILLLDNQLGFLPKVGLAIIIFANTHQEEYSRYRCRK